jgi:peptidoglycan hydrolase CwlO-like protein
VGELRQKFEALPDIADKLHTVEFTESHNTYHAKLANSSLSVKFVQGAWYVFQDQQSKIEQLEKEKLELQAKINAVEHVLGCAMIAPKEVFNYAERIEKALRGEL